MCNKNSKFKILLPQALDYTARKPCSKFEKNPAISHSRADVLTCEGLFFQVFFLRTQKVHLIFEIPKSASISVSSHYMETEH